MGAVHTPAEVLDPLFLTNLLKFTIKKRYNVFKTIEFNIFEGRNKPQVLIDCGDFALFWLR